MSDEIAAVIPVRMGSSRIENKAALDFYQDENVKLNLLEWKIEQLKSVMNPEMIYVSTESESLKLMAKNLGVKIHDRDHYLAEGHKASFSEVITGIVKDIPAKHIAWVTAVVPLMSPQEYKGAFETYIENCKAGYYDSLVSVNLVKEYFWDDSSSLNYKATSEHTISQELPDWYRVTNGLYMMSKEKILSFKYLLGDNPYKFQVGKIAGVDIDEYQDYEIAKSLLTLYLSGQNNTP